MNGPGKEQIKSELQRVQAENQELVRAAQQAPVLNDFLTGVVWMGFGFCVIKHGWKIVIYS